MLVPIRLATTLLWLAEAGLFEPLWSETILNEVERSLPKVGVTPDQAARRVAMMRDAFGLEATVDGCDDLIPQMGCDPKDRHVLAAAVHGDAEAVVTFNLRDFPEEAGLRWGIRFHHPDDFLVQLLSEDAEVVLAVVERGTAALRRPPQTSLEFLSTLTPTAPMFAQLAAAAKGQPE